MHIFHGLSQTSIGEVLLAATADGLCFTHLIDDKQRQADQNMLAAVFPGVSFSEDALAVEPYTAALEEFLQGKTARYCPVLDMVQGTVFQHRVWAELQRVPAGQTITYAELAARVGQPTAVRAVAGACARNVIAIAVPCHRVVRSDGSLSGYRWGINTKRRLLALEARPATLPLSLSA